MTLTMNQPWLNIRTAHRLIILDICAELFDKERHVIQSTCLTLNFDLDLEPTLVKHKHCTSTHHT